MPFIIGSVAAGVIGAAGSMFGSSKQAQAAKQAAGYQLQEFKGINQQQHPFLEGGYEGLSRLEALLGISHPTGRAPPGYGSLLKPFDQSDWQSLSPMYDFVRQQGQQGVLNGDAAGQGALSGAAQKDLMGFNQNLANESFTNAFNMYQTQQGNIYQRLANMVNLGQNAASMTGQQGTALMGQAGQAMMNSGTAMGGGIVGASNALSGGAMSAMPWLYANSGAGYNGGSGVVTQGAIDQAFNESGLNNVSPVVPGD